MQAAVLLACGGLALLMAPPDSCRAEDIVPFRFTAMEGYATIRYLRDEFVTGQPAAGGTPVRSRQAQADLRQELFLMTHSYAYHPSLLSFDIGGGPVLQRQSFASDTSSDQSKGALYNLTGRATILRDKPYRGSVFYDHLNPTLSVSPGQVLTQQNTRYGFDMSILGPVTPVPVYVDATRAHSQGRGVDRIIDDMLDRLNFKATRSFGALGATQVQYQSTKQASISGSPNLPVQASNSTTQSVSADSRFTFGANRQFDLVNLLALNTQSYVTGQSALPDRRDARAFLDVRGRHSEQLQSFATYNYNSSNQGALSSVVNAVSAGASYWPHKDLTATVSVHGENNRTSQYTSSTTGVDASGRYQHALPLGSVQVNYAVRRDLREQKAVANQTAVIGERVTLTGIAYSPLSHQHVVGGSVLVSNNTRTQSFVEGSDYTITVVGLEMRLQRLIGGNIVDGQEVLVDYSYDVGGTYAYAQSDQTLNINWSLRNYVSVYLRFIESTPRLTSGSPTFQLNTVHGSLYGVRADMPLKTPFESSVGGSFESEDRREAISPYTRVASDVYVQSEDPFFGTGNVRVGMRRTRVDYANSTQNVNLTAYDFRYWSQRWFGLDLSADASYERDIGGVLPRSRMAASIKGQWRYRKASLTLDIGRSRETQGNTERVRNLIQLVGRREF